MKLYTLKVRGMRSALDVSSIERLLKAVKGIDAVNVNIVNAMVKVRCADDVGLENIKDIIAGNGYSFYESKEEAAAEKPAAVNKKAIFISWLVFAVILAADIILYLPKDQFLGNNLYLEKILSTLEFVLCTGLMHQSRQYILRGLKELFSGNPRMDSLASLGCVSGYIYSMANVVLVWFNYVQFAHYMYFASAAFIVLVQKMGALWLKNLHDIRYYLPLQDVSADTQAVLIQQGEKTVCGYEMVFPKDMIALQAGDKTLAEGIIVAGEAVVDESSVNGKSMPVIKKKGEKIWSGSVICGGEINVQVTVSESAGEKEKQVNDCILADIFSNDGKAVIYLPLVMIAAIVAGLNYFFYTGDFNYACRIFTVVLLVSAPGLLCISVASAVKKALQRANRQGIYFKRLQALLKVSEISLAVFGKTGTLTDSKLTVTDIVTFNGVNEQAAVGLAASLECESLHPVAVAIKEYAIDKKMFACSNISCLPGCGIKGTHQNVKVALGSYDYIRKICRVAEDIKKLADGFAVDGKAAIYLAAQNQICAVFALGEKFNEPDRSALQKIHDLGIRSVMITGDDSRYAERAARYFGVARVMSELNIEEKCTLLRSLQQGGEKIAFLGENFCDRPLHRAADIGISLSDSTRRAADIIFTRRDLGLFAESVALSRKLLSKISRNMNIIFTVNLLTVIVVLSGLYKFSDVVLSPLAVMLLLSINLIITVLTA